MAPAVLPPLELTAVDVVVAHATAKTCLAQTAKKAGRTAATAKRTKRTGFRKDVPDHMHAAFLLVPFAVEACARGYMGKDAVRLVKRLGNNEGESRRILKGAFARWAMNLLLVPEWVPEWVPEMLSPPHTGGGGAACPR